GGPEPLLPDTVPADSPYRPLLARSPLTFAAPYDSDRPAAEAMRWDVHDALPRGLAVVGDGATWTPVFDLLASDRFSPDVAVEVETGGGAPRRVGGGGRGRRPPPPPPRAAGGRPRTAAAAQSGGEGAPPP